MPKRYARELAVLTPFSLQQDHRYQPVIGAMKPEYRGAVHSPWSPNRISPRRTVREIPGGMPRRGGHELLGPELRIGRSIERPGASEQRRHGHTCRKGKRQ